MKRSTVTSRPIRGREARVRILEGLVGLPRPFDQEADPVHVTGSAVVVGRRGTVLHLHKRLHRWMQPGGHIDPGEAPWEAARRESEEETGSGRPASRRGAPAHPCRRPRSGRGAHPSRPPLSAARARRRPGATPGESPTPGGTHGTRHWPWPTRPCVGALEVARRQPEALALADPSGDGPGGGPRRDVRGGGRTSRRRSRRQPTQPGHPVTSSRRCSRCRTTTPRSTSSATGGPRCPSAPSWPPSRAGGGPRGPRRRDPGGPTRRARCPTGPLEEQIEVGPGPADGAREADVRRAGSRGTRPPGHGRGGQAPGPPRHRARGPGDRGDGGARAPRRGARRRSTERDALRSERRPARGAPSPPQEQVIDAELADRGRGPGAGGRGRARRPAGPLRDGSGPRSVAPGAARLVGGSCSGCHLVLPSMEVDRIRKAPPDAVITCDQCGRILVR